MCLITFAYRSHPDFSLILVANRDEFYARPTLSAHAWDDHPGVFAGRDLEEGGTWLGVTEGGKMAAVTNYRDGLKYRNSLQSRGHLTRDFLTSDLSAGDYMLDLSTRSANYGGFNLLCGDGDAMFYQSNAGGGMRKLEPGVYGLSNAHLDTSWPKVEKARAGMQRVLQSGQPDIASVSALLQDPEPADDDELPDTGVGLEWERLLSSQFIRKEGYGTRCTTVVLQATNGETVFHEQNFSETGPGETLTRVIGAKARGGDH